jgi:hypothetical protein
MNDAIKTAMAALVAMPLDTYEGACAAGRAAGDFFADLPEGTTEADIMPALIFANRARNQRGALNPNPAAPNFRNVGP